jgi:hypothetical protein
MQYRANEELMTRLSPDYSPFFRDGRLYLPEKTIALLLEAGLNRDIAQAARHGLLLDEQRRQINEITRLLERVTVGLARNSDAFRTLTAPETRFMLTGWPAEV